MRASAGSGSATGGSADTHASDAGPPGWRTRPSAAFALVALAALLPVAASMLGAEVVGGLMPRRAGLLGAAAWWGAIIAASIVTVVLVDRSARRLLPIAALYRL